MSFGQILYYDGYGSYGFSEKFRLLKPLKDIKKSKYEKCIFREFDNEKNEHRTKSLLSRIR